MSLYKLFKRVAKSLEKYKHSKKIFSIKKTFYTLKKSRNFLKRTGETAQKREAQRTSSPWLVSYVETSRLENKVISALGAALELTQIRASGASAGP